LPVPNVGPSGHGGNRETPDVVPRRSQLRVGASVGAFVIVSCCDQILLTEQS
jgi:hypothetical protein